MSGYVVCSQCNCVELKEMATVDRGVVLCSHCGPNKQWHGLIAKEKYDPTKHRVENRPSGIGLS